MNNIPVNDVLGFFYSIVSRLFSFINSNSLVKWFVYIPLACGFLCVIFYFIFDVSHILDDYKAKHQKFYKGSKNTDYNNRKYKNKSPVKYGEFSKDYTYKNGQAYKKNEFRKDELLDVNSSYDDKVRYAKMHNKVSETSIKIENYYKRQQANLEADRSFNKKHNNVFDVEYEDE